MPSDYRALVQEELTRVEIAFASVSTSAAAINVTAAVRDNRAWSIKHLLQAIGEVKREFSEYERVTHQVKAEQPTEEVADVETAEVVGSFAASMDDEQALIEEWREENLCTTCVHTGLCRFEPVPEVDQVIVLIAIGKCTQFKIAPAGT